MYLECLQSVLTAGSVPYLSESLFHVHTLDDLHISSVINSNSYYK